MTEPTDPPTQPTRGVLDVLNELDALVAATADPRSCSLLVLGFALAMVRKAGWSFDELTRLRAWPRASET